MDSLRITRKAFGRSAKLGDLYDATTDTFLNESMFSSSIPEKISTNLCTTFECYANRFDKITKMCDGEAELEVRFLLEYL